MEEDVKTPPQQPLTGQKGRVQSHMKKIQKTIPPRSRRSTTAGTGERGKKKTKYHNLSKGWGGRRKEVGYENESRDFNE